jgi:hypothetical protein
MFRMIQRHALFALMIVGIPATLSADPDLPVSVTAGCFSVCIGDANVKGVQGNVTITNVATTATFTGTIKVQCNGTDVTGTTQTLGPVSGAPSSNTIIPYSISFTPVVGCSYTVVATVMSSALSPPTRSTTTSTAFAANCMDQPCGTTGCTLTQGFWKNHPEDWPVTSLKLGTVTYTQAQLLSILDQPVRGNGLVSLAHQLIAVKLNIANGASGTVVNSAIASADAMIGGLVVPPVGSGSLSTSSVGGLVTQLDQFNQGLAAGGPGHCSE